MQINAMSHLLRTARTSGVLDALRGGQKTLDQLCADLSLDTAITSLFLDALISIGIVEQYGEDFALARAAQLLCQYDHDFGDEAWSGLEQKLREGRPNVAAPEMDQAMVDHTAATQWSQTGAAIQAAEILNIGGEGEPQGVRILDLGCGSAVFSCAIAHHDPQSTLVAVDHRGALQAAKSTGDSIELSDRMELVEADLQSGEMDWADTLDEASFDLVLLAQRLSVLSSEAAVSMLGVAAKLTKPGGRVVLVDVFRGQSRPTLTESIGALRIATGTGAGYVRSLKEAQQLMLGAGLGEIQFTYLAASREHLGMMVARKIT
ncbi:N5-glutamine S-adenosyl-L-methionine-dependent methyltransferase [Stieleria varia]|uniref:N5-glutamine S-adenosyl-L-methionine-dependent methyltransferase n=2 Tax=Stieleria varia TaxID=2528005 RepID=A0A5C6A2X5_9BACT|nr:N5-glutamine S-adenosyl-L-methionine-dependent methyltransferase [Stieleria varia]